MSPRPRCLLVSRTYLSILRHYAAPVDAELERIDPLLPESELDSEHDWLNAYLELRLRVEMLVLVLSGLVSDPRIGEFPYLWPSSPDTAEPSSLSLAD